MSINLRGKIIKPDKISQRSLPKENFIAEASYVKDVSNCSFVNIRQIHNPIDINTAYLKEHLHNLIDRVDFLLLTKNNIILSHIVSNNILTVSPIILTQEGILSLESMNFSLNSELFCKFFKPLSEYKNLEKFKLSASTYKMLMRTSFNGAASEFNSAQLYRHCITTGDFRELKPAELMVIRR